MVFGIGSPVQGIAGDVAKKAEAEKKKKEAEIAAAAEAEKKRKQDEATAEIQKRFEGYTPEQIASVSGTGPAEMQATLAQREEALKGFEASQLEAMRAQMAAGQQAGQQQRERALQAALAQRGVQGGAAAALQAQMAQRAYQEKGAMDTEMLLRQEQRQREALGEYEKSVMGAYQAEQERQFQALAAQLAAEQAIQAELARQAGLEEAELYKTGQVEAAEASGKVICTELYHQGLMSEQIYKADQAFGKIQDLEVMIGYHAWALPVVRLMKRSKAATWLAHKIATPWANQMAFEMGVVDKPNLIGMIMMVVGIPCCRLIGKLKGKRVSHGY
jgi:hypothetical protein